LTRKYHFDGLHFKGDTHLDGKANGNDFKKNTFKKNVRSPSKMDPFRGDDDHDPHRRMV
jgi:hypothetical protein